MLSVIVPIYKVERYLRQCVDSILNQSYRDLEVLLIDDGSPDKCGEICDEFGRRDKRVRVFHTENRGLSAARNLGLKEARGEYIGFVDSDDWIEPEMYEELLRRMCETGADIGVCGFWYEYPERAIAADDFLEKTFTKKEAIAALIFSDIKSFVWNKVYRTNLWDGIFFPEGHVFEDVATTYKTIIGAGKVASITRCFYHYRRRTDSIGSIRSMSNLIDYWAAYYGRYVVLQELSGIENRFIDKLQEQVANAAVKTWRWVYMIPAEQRDQEYLMRVSDYVKNHYSLFGKKEWRFYLRLGIFLVRFINGFSFALCYYLNLGYRTYLKRDRMYV